MEYVDVRMLHRRKRGSKWRVEGVEISRMDGGVENVELCSVDEETRLDVKEK